MSRLFFAPIPSRRAAEETPANRDRVVDAARAFSLVIVVVGHGFMAVVGWENGVPRISNVLAAHPWTQALTWIFQIIPLLFFAGGAANTISWDRHVARGGKFPEWMWSRTERLLRPVWPFLLIVGVIAPLVTRFTPRALAVPLLFLATQLLWFLGAYLLITMLTPLFRSKSPKHAAVITFVIVLASGVIDSLRLFAHWPAVGLLNFVLVWTVPTYLGSLRARGILRMYSKRSLLAVLFLSILMNALLIRIGPWPFSFVGMPGNSISNMAPPTIVLALHSVVWVCAVALLNEPLTRLLARENIWRPITGVNLSAMTLYLWHLPVLTAVFALSHSLGLDRPTRIGADHIAYPAGWGYFAGSFPFWLVFGIGVWGIVRLMWPLEHVALPWWGSSPHNRAPRDPWGSIWAGIGVFGAGSALLMLAATGLWGFPGRVREYGGVSINNGLAVGILVLSAVLIRWSGAPRTQKSGSPSEVCH